MLHRFRQFFDNGLALDLGTATTQIGAVGAGIVVNEPSLVAVPAANSMGTGGGAVGKLAWQMQGRTPGSVHVIRPVREGAIHDFRHCEFMLRYFLRKAQQSAWRMRPVVLVAAPGAITPVEKQALYSSLLRAGARHVWLLQAAKAAALGAEVSTAEPVAGMVCDLGAGTTDVAILSMQEVVAENSLRIGCDALDEAIIEYLKQEQGLRVGPPAAERLRKDFGSAFPLTVELSGEVRGLDTTTGLPRELTITSTELRGAMAAPLERIARAICTVLDNCAPDLAADLLDTGIVLTGGGALLRQIDDFLADRTRLPVRVAPQPLTATARGALACLEHLHHWRGGLESSDDDG